MRLQCAECPDMEDNACGLHQRTENDHNQENMDGATSLKRHELSAIALLEEICFYLKHPWESLKRDATVCAVPPTRIAVRTVPPTRIALKQTADEWL